MSFPDLGLTPLNRLILAYAKPAERRHYALLFALDSRLADIVRSSTEILIAQMKLTWWRDILTTPDAEKPVGEPLVEMIKDPGLKPVQIEALQTLIDGWETVLDDFPWEDRIFSSYADKRGRGFFGFIYPHLSAEIEKASENWALWDFARHCSDEKMRGQAFSRVVGVKMPSFDRSGRPLSILCKLVERDAKKAVLSGDLYNPGTAVRIVWHGITGL